MLFGALAARNAVKIGLPASQGVVWLWLPWILLQACISLQRVDPPPQSQETLMELVVMEVEVVEVVDGREPLQNSTTCAQKLGRLLGV